ncbi:MAG: PilZ domain-containing protein [Spirochaetes bacterium]|nr:PilZ domain-containing protein [Spirochaetota bacterium]
MEFSNRFLEMLKLKGKTQVHQVDYTGAIILLLLLVVAVLIIITVYYIRKKYNFLEHKNFNTLAKSANLNIDETRILFNLITKNRIKYPLTCFTNAKLLDDILKKGIKEIHSNKNLNNNQKNEKIDELIDIKMKIEANSKKNIGIKSTHLISESQKIIVFIRGKGYFYATVKNNLKNYLIIELISELITKRLLNKDEFIKIYFWRNEDAGYIFETKILDLGQSIRSYLIKHSDQLIRSQKRKYKRIPVNFSAVIFPILKNKKNEYKILQDQPEQCNIVDLSAGGIKLLIDNINQNIKLLKVEFSINTKKVTLIGRIIRIINKPNNIKEVILIFLKISMESKNIINEYIYNYLPSNI